MVSRTSRKKSKGRERKAKKIEAERAMFRDEWLGWVTGDTIVGKSITCDHGCGGIPSLDDVDHPVLSFLDEFCRQGFSVESMFYTRPRLTNFGEILKQDINREMLINIMIRMGTNMILKYGLEPETRWALTLAKSIVILEQCVDDTGSISYTYSRVVSRKIKDLYGGSRRDALKFFSKRVSCSCLKSMHQEARRTILKTGKCYHCKIEKERVALSVCSRCMITQYCSRECQVADWSEHKEDCEIYIDRERGV